eukprot:TRINITY_DN6773_c0_g1_i1.p1 TRINITY_DN6773_c0_g1~~TRINITY_DN6773_c0_g1_i1.p1  ORF type:complete len:298 (+),score=69.03 TRINITY_DN6773_c0_g1_i1:84-977(+)
MSSPSSSPKVAVEVEGLTYSYGGGGHEVLHNVNLKLHSGSRCLLIGGNGTGKSTLLRILAGKNLTHSKVIVLGQDAYHHTPSGLNYLGGEWANNPTVRRDVSVPQLLSSVNADKYPARSEMLIKLLDVDLEWKMHKVSDGERRRVQLLMGLIQPYEVLLLDEVTVDLDVLVRRDFLNFLKTECDTRHVTIIYATHIFDGLGEWPTHIAHISNGSITTFDSMPNLVELQILRSKQSLAHSSDDSPLLLFVEILLRQEFEVKKKRRIEHPKKEKDMMTVVEKKGEDMRQYRDKFYNYWG